MPATLFRYIWKTSAHHQILLCVLSVVVFLLSAAPLELQRRIVNDAIAKGAVNAIIWLAIAYAGVALLEGAVKLWLNIYRSWVAERAVLLLRRSISGLTVQAVSGAEEPAKAGGVEAAMILSEVEPIGGFIGVSLSEPLLQGGVLLSVFGYLAYLEPWMAALSVAVFSPQLVFVPMMQGAINRRAAERIQTLRDVSCGIVESATADAAGVETQQGNLDNVFVLNMGIFKLKFGMNFLMNLMHHLGVATVLGVGGYYVVQGSLQVGTVVAFVSGLAKVNDPWGDLVNWYRDKTVVEMRYKLIADAMRGLAPDSVRETPMREVPAA